MNNRTGIGSVTRASILLSILIALSGMAAMAMAAPDMDPPPNWFLGSVTINGAPAPVGTVISAFIDGESRGSIPVESLGEYKYLRVEGNTSDDGKNVTFTVCGANAEPNGTWIAWTTQGARIHNLTAVDNVAPAVTNANANPSSIVADGVETTQLRATVIDGCRVGNVTVNLSAIGGDAAQVMAPSGGDTYSVDTNASVGTAPGTYYLYVNASDGFKNCNTSVCIALEVTTTGLPKDGDINDDGSVNTLDAIHLAKYYTGAGSEKFRIIFADGDINSDGSVNTLDAIHLAKYYTGAGSEKFRTIYT